MNVNNKNIVRLSNVPNITIIGSNTNANNLIKVVPVNEFTKTYKNEFNVLLKKPNEQQHDILQFMDDTTSNYLFSEKSIFLQQLVNKKIKNNDEADVGVGSTFRKERRSYRVETEEATNYKFTIDKGKAQKIFRTVPQQVNSNSRYFVFVRKNKTTFEAHPVANWYKMHPYTKLDANAVEESEREFARGRQVVEDQLNRMIREEKSDGYGEMENKVHLMANADGELSEDEITDCDVLNKRKKAQLFQKLRYGKKQFVDEESDKDDHEGDEVDYMSDSSCDETQLSEGDQEKIYECVNVDEEEMLTKELELSDQSDDEKEDQKKEEKAGEPEEVIVSSDDSESDDDDDDSDSDDSDKARKARNEANTNLSTLKRVHMESSPITGTVKRPKIDDPKQKEVVEEVRKHLTRKPMSGKELFRMLIKKQLLVNDELSKKKLMDAFFSLSAKHDMVNGERMYRL